MPGNVTNDSFNGVLPWSLSTAFSATQERPVRISEYKDGSSQRKEQAATDRYSYSLSKRLTPAAMTTLRSFYLDNIGKAFKVYTKKSDYDAMNSSFKLMRFEGAWNEQTDLGRWTTSIQLVQVA